jgi:uncharacterized membrane-anchored protein
LGDSLADTFGFGYGGGALIFAGALVLVAGAYLFTKISHTTLFWLAFILTRPLGATLGDLLTKLVASGGLHLGRIRSSLTFIVLIIAAILFTSRKSAGYG